jgi:hypothetical protein
MKIVVIDGHAIFRKSFIFFGCADIQTQRLL